MSLDVYLNLPGAIVPAGPGIFIRENGERREITREEWDSRFPGQEPVTALSEESETIYWANITHNLGRMANAAGIYKHLWRPDEIGITHARQLIEPLQDGLRRLESEPDKYRALNPENGWGTYEGLVRFVEKYLAACRHWRDAEVSVSR